MNEQESRDLNPAQHITVHFSDESLQAIICTGTDNKINGKNSNKQKRHKTKITITNYPHTHTQTLY